MTCEGTRRGGATRDLALECDVERLSSLRESRGVQGAVVRRALAPQAEQMTAREAGSPFARQRRALPSASVRASEPAPAPALATLPVHKQVIKQ